MCQPNLFSVFVRWFPKPMVDDSTRRATRVSGDRRVTILSRFAVLLRIVGISGGTIAAFPRHCRGRAFLVTSLPAQKSDELKEISYQLCHFANLMHIQDIPNNKTKVQ